MFIADGFINIKHVEGIEDPDYAMIEKLDEMLNEYNIGHFFSLPLESTDGVADNEEDILSLGYEERDYCRFALVYLMWSKEYRHVPDGKIWSMMHKVSGKHGEQGIYKEA